MEDVLKEAKLKALNLLNFADRTESQLRKKLKEKSYSDEVIEQTIDYVKSYGYINDVGYSERYILNKQRSKSRREIYLLLCQKGVSKADIDSAMENCYEADGEAQAICRLCEKRHFVAEEATDSEKKKMYNYLLRKGFRNDDVCKLLKI